MTDYKTLYGRMLEDHPAYTISASFANVTSGCYTHPRHNRALTVREGCRLQGFPDCFEVVGPVPAQYRQIGNAVPALVARKLIEHLEAAGNGRHVDAVKMRLDQRLLFAESHPKFPVLTPRYQRVGYGSGTYWPKGWGKAPLALPTSATGYRISSVPFRSRRTDWRKVREESLAAAFDGLERLDWSPTVQRLRGSDDRVAAVIDGLTPLDSSQSAADSAKSHFLEFLGPATCLIAAAALRTGDVFVRVDFGLTGDWLIQLLAAIGIRTGRPVAVVDVSRLESAASPRTPSIWVTAGPVPVRLDPARISSIFLVTPFADQLRSLGLGGANSRQIAAPTDRLRIRTLDVTWTHLVTALVASASAGHALAHRQASLFPAAAT